jgi:Uma2 family endonuclease
MNVQLPVHMDKPSFLAWLAGQEGRYELVEGHVVMMARPARAHARILLNLAITLRSQLDPRLWEVIAEFGLDAGPETLRYPDIVVDRAGGANGDYTATAPVVLIEVLSPSSVVIDLRDKAAEYLQLPSLNAYLVFSQDAPKAWVWTRAGEEFAAKPTEIAGYDKVIRIEAPSFALPLAEIYAGIEPD